MSEPVHIKDILPDVMNDIRHRVSLYSNKHQAGVLSALKGYKGSYHRPARRKGRNQGEAGASLAYSSKLLKGNS